MKPEPLKDKIQLDTPKNYKIFSFDDIKSAVEWLKEEIERLGFKVYKEPLGVKTIIIAIDKSFPDIVKDTEKSNKISVSLRKTKFSKRR